MAAPLAVGVAFALTTDGAAMVVLGMLAVVATSVLTLLILRPFAAADADMIDRLDMPMFLKRPLLRAVAALSR